MSATLVKNMRTLHYVASFFPYARGATHSALRLAQGLRNVGVEVDFVVEQLGPEWVDGGTYEGFSIRSLPLTNPGKIRKLKGFRQLYHFLRARRGDVDIFHVHGGPYMNLLLAWLAGRWLNCPTLMKITLDGWDTPDGVASGRHGRWAIRLYNKLDQIVAMTSGQADKCRKWNIKGRVDVIPNSVRTDVFKPVNEEEKARLRARFNIPVDKPVMCYAGYLGYVKGTDILFKVWNQLRNKIPGLQLLLVGNYMGTENMSATLDVFLQSHGIPPELSSHPDVHETGKLDNIAPGLQCSDIFVFPSRQEGFGTVQIEAMSCGLPCVVNDIPGVSCDIYPNEAYGIRIPDNRVDLFVEAITAILSDRTRLIKMGKRAREAAIDRFSTEHVADQYLELYRQLVARRGSSAATSSFNRCDSVILS